MNNNWTLFRQVVALKMFRNTGNTCSWHLSLVLVKCFSYISSCNEFQWKILVCIMYCVVLDISCANLKVMTQYDLLENANNICIFSDLSDLIGCSHAVLGLKFAVKLECSIQVT